MRKNLTERAVQNYTKVAEGFQEARETNRLKIVQKLQNSIEDLSISLKQLKYLLQEPSKSAFEVVSSPQKEFYEFITGGA